MMRTTLEFSLAAGLAVGWQSSIRVVQSLASGTSYSVQEALIDSVWRRSRESHKLFRREVHHGSVQLKFPQVRGS